MTNNKLPEWRKALNKAVENYQSTQAWYEENPDNHQPSRMLTRRRVRLKS
ncbi:hypothetical protein J3163_000394 [Salmonella enterica]|nr:hypothetical protein [Salmonella enterica]